MTRDVTGTSAPHFGRATLPILLFVVFISLTAFGGILPLIPFYGKVFGVPAWQVTLLFTTFSLGQMVGELNWGRLSDRIGRRPVLLITMVGAGLSFFAFAYAPGIWIAVLLRFACGLFCGNLSTVQGYLADVSPPDRLTQHLGLIGTMQGIGFVVGPVVGGLLVHPEAGLAGMRPPIFASTIAYAVGAVFVFFLLKESRVRRGEGAARMSQMAGMRGAIRDPIILKVIGTTAIGFFSFSMVSATIGLWGEHRFDWTARDVGIVFGVIGAGGALGQTLWYRTWAKRFSELTNISGSLLLAAVGLALTAVSTGPVLGAAAICAAVIGHMSSQPATIALVSKLTSPDHQGAVLGANMACGAMARMGGPLAAGMMMTYLGYSIPFAAAALVLLPAIWLAWSAAKGRKPSTATEPA
jgi:MFS transporter, DHA1 family, tetracycline resistance protein